MKIEIHWINYVKSICILSVYFVHTTSYYGFEIESCKFIHPFYVNAFFFISGYLLFRKQLSQKLLQEDYKQFVLGGGRIMVNNILCRLMYPTLLFSIIEFFPSHVIRGHGFDWGTFMYKTIGGCTYWFTAALVVAEVILLLFLFTRKKSIWFYIVCSCAIYVLGQYIVINDINLFLSYPSLPWQYKHGMFAILFLAFGGLYWRYESIINKLINKYTLGLMLVLYLILLTFFPKDFHVLISMLNMNILGIAISLLSILILIEICKLLPKLRLLDYIGKNTLGLYFMSGALPIVLSLVVNKLFSTNYYGLIIVFIGSVTIALLAVYLMNKFTPWLFDIRLIWKKK